MPGARRGDAHVVGVEVDGEWDALAVRAGGDYYLPSSPGKSGECAWRQWSGRRRESGQESWDTHLTVAVHARIIIGSLRNAGI